MSDKPLYEDFNYIQGQISALHALILGLSQNIPKAVFREQSLARLDAERNRLLFSTDTGADMQRKAIDATEQWVRSLTESE